MTQTIIATFEDGVLKPAQPLHLPEHTQVRITIQPLRDEIQREWEATKEQRLAAIEGLMRAAKPHPGPHLTREQLHERR